MAVDSGVFATVEGRLALTFAILAAFGLVVLFAPRVVSRVRERFDSPLVQTVAGLVVLGAAALAGYGLVLTWRASAELAAVYQRLGGGDPVRVGTRVGVTVMLFAAVYVATRLAHRAVMEFAEGRREFSRHEAEVVYRVTQVVSYLFAVVVALGLWKVNLSGVLIGAGFLGIVVGMAARQTLGAMLAGFVLMFSRPFEIGDWVQIEDKEGIVTDITVVNTRLQTFDGEYVMLPNDLVGSSEVVNRSRKGRLRLRVEVGVDYATDLERATSVVRDAVGGVDDVLAVPQPQVVLKRFDDSAIVLGVRFWIDKPSARRKWRARTAVVGAVKEALEEEGVKIPFPQRELSGRPEEGGLRLAGEGAAVDGAVDASAPESNGDDD